jgi:uncharacterized RmlC-like cupin family protein
MTRAAAITKEVGAEKLWAGRVRVAPAVKAAPHHHGELETIIYVVKGKARYRWGNNLEFVVDAEPGDFIYIPPFVPHQEINASDEMVTEVIVVRSGQDPIVVSLDIVGPDEMRVKGS